MGKKNKNPKTAFYFYMLDRQKQFEGEGRQVGLRQIGSDADIHTDFKNLDPTQRAKYDEMLKEYKAERQLKLLETLTPDQLENQKMQIAGLHVQKKAKAKENISNNYTIFGNNYQILLSRQKDNKEEEAKFLEELLNHLTQDDEELDLRFFVTMASTYSFETNEHEFFPAELTIVGFNLEEGIKKDYWTLVDTQRIRVGYSNFAKTLREETGLPIPGHRDFNPEHRDYLRILRNIKRYVETFVIPYKGFTVIFTMPDELTSAKGCIKWLIDNAEYETAQEQYEFKSFFSKLKFCKLTSLMMKLGQIAKFRTPECDSLIAQFSFMENAAEEILNKVDLDYDLRISCSFHAQVEESAHLDTCCRSLARRRVYFIFSELLPFMNVEVQEGHFISCSNPPPPYIKQSEIDDMEEKNPHKRPRLDADLYKTEGLSAESGDLQAPNHNFETAYKTEWTSAESGDILDPNYSLDPTYQTEWSPAESGDIPDRNYNLNTTYDTEWSSAESGDLLDPNYNINTTYDTEWSSAESGDILDPNYNPETTYKTEGIPAESGYILDQNYNLNTTYNTEGLSAELGDIPDPNYNLDPRYNTEGLSAEGGDLLGPNYNFNPTYKTEGIPAESGDIPDPNYNLYPRYNTEGLSSEGGDLLGPNYNFNPTYKTEGIPADPGNIPVPNYNLDPRYNTEGLSAEGGDLLGPNYNFNPTYKTEGIPAESGDILDQNYNLNATYNTEGLSAELGDIPDSNYNLDPTYNTDGLSAEGVDLLGPNYNFNPTYKTEGLSAEGGDLLGPNHNFETAYKTEWTSADPGNIPDPNYNFDTIYKTEQD